MSELLKMTENESWIPWMVPVVRGNAKPRACPQNVIRLPADDESARELRAKLAAWQQEQERRLTTGESNS